MASAINSLSSSVGSISSQLGQSNTSRQSGIGSQAANSLAGMSGGMTDGMNDISGPATSGSTFADTMKQYLSEVSQLQSEASGQVEKLVTGQSDDLAGVMTAMEKSDLAFRTLLTIRTKLMDAYNELRNMQM